MPQRCSRCILPETIPHISFDENGVCQLCQDYKTFVPKGEQELGREIGNYVKTGGKYNCIVPVSGGRDSSYALWYAKNVLELSPIAVHNDNDFETEIAGKNLENITKSLDVPLVRISSSNGISKKIVAEKFKMNAPFSAGLIVEQTCEACKYGFESASYNTARKKGVQLVIWGDSKYESTAPLYAMQNHDVPTKWRRLLSSGAISLLKYKYYFRRMRREYGPNSSEGLKEIHLFDYIEWDRKVIVETIQKIGWAKPQMHATSWRIDCSLVPLVNYLTKKAYGVSKLEIGFSNMVRSGKMDRNDALRETREIENSADVNNLENFLKEMNICQATIKRVLY
jgi:glucosamine--fructose-6-phosphate aminotransferase (isomerizing)